MSGPHLALAVPHEDVAMSPVSQRAQILVPQQVGAPRGCSSTAAGPGPSGCSGSSPSVLAAAQSPEFVCLARHTSVITS